MMSKYFPRTGLLVQVKSFTAFEEARPDMSAPHVPIFRESTMAITVPYSHANAIKTTLEEGDFTDERITIDLDDIPLCGCGNICRRVKEYEFDRETSAHNAVHRVMMTERIICDNPIWFADPLTALLAANEFPRLQCFHDLVTIFTTNSGALAHLLLSESEGARTVEICRIANEHKYDQDTHYLVVLP